MKKNIIFIFILCLLLVYGCNSEDDRDMQLPTIEMNSSTSFPQNCVILYRGEAFTFSAEFHDNQELGSYNLEIHNNFDHHSHSTDDVECDLFPIKEPVNPFVYNQDYAIPEGLTVYEAKNEILVPADIDIGDYHFMIRVTDKAGWQQLKAISVKILDRE